MFNLQDILEQAQGGAGVDNLAAQFGVDPAQARAAIEALTPALSAGLQQQTQQPGGLADLFGAMMNGQHHSAFDTPAALGDPATSADGADLLSSLFGGNPQAQHQLAQYAARSSGLSSTIIQAMLPVIVSMIAGGLFKGMQGKGWGDLLNQMGQAGANAPGNSSGGLGDILGQVLGGSLGGSPGGSAQRAPQAPQAPQAPAGGGLGGLLGGLLGGILGGGASAGSTAGADQPMSRGGSRRADQVFPQGYEPSGAGAGADTGADAGAQANPFGIDPASLQAGIDALGKMFNPGGAASGGGKQPGLEDLLGQLLGGGRR